MKHNPRIAILIVFGATIGLSCSENSIQAPVPATQQESFASAIVEALAREDMAAATKDFSTLPILFRDVIRTRSGRVEQLHEADLRRNDRVRSTMDTQED